jgi:putative transposase
MARKSGYLQRPIDIAIDTTDILYYGDRCDYMVVGTKPQKGTTWAFKFATVNAVLDGERFVLYAIPVGPKTRPVDIVAKLMTGIGGRVKIRRAYLDRGFFGRRVIEHLNRNGVKYIMPVRRDSRIESIMERHRPPYVTQYRMKKRNSEYSGVWFNLAVVKGMKAGCEDKVYAFATNIDFTANMAPAILSSYDRRWGIETAFRVKESFRARTTSKNYLIRLFYFMFSITLYNLWVLLNSLLSIMLFGKPAGKPIVTAKIFGTILCVADIT